MVQVFEFNDDILGGCRIKMRVADDESLSGICAECVKRVCTILENMNMINLVHIIRNKNFVLTEPLTTILCCTDESVFQIKSVQV